MSTTNMLYDQILKRQKELFLNKAELAELSGVSEPTITRIEKGEDVSLASLRDVCLAMDLVLTTIDRSEIVKKEIAEKEAEIEQAKEKLRSLELEKQALVTLMNK